MKKVIIAVVILCVVVTACFLGGSLLYESQRADYGWRATVAVPTFPADHPRALVDAAHYNASTIDLAGRYWPFGCLLRADGYSVRENRKPFTLERLRGAQVLVIVNASGAAKPQIFGINLPIPVKGERKDPAFTAAEILAVREWVEQGGSLLLIADHAPFGEAAAALGSAFGVTMHRGFTEVPNEPSDPLLFGVDNGRLADHPIVRGDGHQTRVRRVTTFTGQSLDGPPGSTLLLRLPETAMEFVPVIGDSLAAQPAGQAQGLAFEWGQGRVVVLGEAAMLTAQVSRGVPFGMNTPGNDNRQFALNTMHWLSRKL